MKARILAFFALWITVAGVIFSAPGCYGRNCEGGVATYGLDAGQGEMVSDTQWESSPEDGQWLPFPRERTWVFDVESWGGRTPFSKIAYLSAQQAPNVPGPNSGNDTIGAGNIALYQNVSANHIEVVNDTCSDYFLRLAVSLPPLPPTATATGTTTTPPPSDGGTH